MRKRNAIAAIVVSGIMMGGAGIAMGGEAAEKSSAPGPAVSLRTDKASGTAAARTSQSTRWPPRPTPSSARWATDASAR